MAQKAHSPTKRDRDQVRKLAGFGLPQEDIATVVGVAKATLRKHYAEELRRGLVEANTKVVESLFNNATKHRNVTAQIFWLKNRLDWVDAKKLDVDQQVTHQFDALSTERRLHLLSQVLNQAPIAGTLEVIDAETVGDAGSTPDERDEGDDLDTAGKANGSTPVKGR